MKNIKSINIKFVDDDKQRYDTSGDYYFTKDQLNIIISKEIVRRRGKLVRNRLVEFLILIHEMVEVLLVVARNISIDKIDEFDMNYKGDSEPGDEPDAPYRKEHQFATKIEKMMAKELGVDWDEYN